MCKVKPETLTRVFFLILMLVIAYLLIVGYGYEKHPRFTSTSHLYKIGLAIRGYGHDYGIVPERLSDLLPHYISTNDLEVFYVTSTSARQEEKPADWRTNPRRVDQFASYVYLGRSNVHEVLAFEKPGLWKSTVDHSSDVAVLFTDYNVHDVPLKKLAELVSWKSDK